MWNVSLGGIGCCVAVSWRVIISDRWIQETQDGPPWTSRTSLLLEASWSTGPRNNSSCSTWTTHAGNVSRLIKWLFLFTYCQPWRIVSYVSVSKYIGFKSVYNFWLTYLTWLNYFQITYRKYNFPYWILIIES